MRCSAADLSNEFQNNSTWGLIPLAASILNVTLTVQFYSLQSLNEEAGTIHVTAFISSAWTDSRVDEMFGECIRNLKPFPSVVLDDTGVGHLWLAKIRIVSDKIRSIALGHQEKTGVVGIHAEAHNNTIVFQSSMSSFTTRCTPDYRKFPFDTIVCTVSLLKAVGSKSPETDFNLQWASNNPVVIKNNSEAGFNAMTSFDSRFKLSKFMTYDYSGNACAVELHMRRHYMFYVLQAYGSGIIFVSISYLSFFVKLESPTRSSLSSASLIAQVLVYLSLSESIPMVGYVRGIDIWYIGCLIFIFVPLAVCALAGFVIRNKEAKVTVSLDRVDRIGMWFFPLAFAVFSVSYFFWITH